MRILTDILASAAVIKTTGNAAVQVTDVCIDSKKVTEGALFIALKGTTTDGHKFIEQAISAGAKSILLADLPEEIGVDITYVQVADTAAVAGLVAASFFNFPSEKMKVVGVTGTNGKTTVATLLFQLFTKLGAKCGLISTVQNQINNTVIIASHTTPDAISIQKLLAEMLQAGCAYVFMEVSSHAVHQKRIAGIHFSGGIFTNITHDHLDYHKTFDEYIRVKKQFFDALPEDGFALTNLDDKRGTVMLQNTKAAKHSYSLKAPSSFKGKVLENNISGLVMMVDNQEAHFRMIGTFNAYNLLAVYASACLLGREKMEVLAVLSDLHGAPGRFETVISQKEKILGIVDYAHTPDALINVLATINQLRNGGQQLITIIGCGGDRDKTKRPLMAQVASEHSDKAILTADNPRTENPESILDEMEAGLTITQKRKALRITDRKEAIKTACALAQAEDIILVAGKGHETYQEINGQKHPFDDREILKTAFEMLQK